MKEVTVSDLRQNLAEVVDTVHYRPDEVTIITNHGVPWAALVSLDKAKLITGAEEIDNLISTKRRNRRNRTK
jgi:prevent-host-death family protein